MTTAYTSSDIVTDSTTIITNVGVPKIVTGSSRADIYIGISTNALCQINLSLHDNYFSSGGTCQVERLTSQQNMYALYLSIPNYYYSSGQAEFRTWNFAMTATTCDNGLEKTTEFSIKQLGCQNTCIITWKNHDGTTLDTDSVQIGTMPFYSGPTPTKESTAQYDYVHTGWTPTIVVASVDTAYTATFSAVTRTYTILWKNYNGNTLEIDENVPYGDIPSYDGSTPEKPATQEHSYVFTGWSPATATVTGDQTYTAQFREESVEYIITWDINGSQETSSYHYNDIPSHSTPQPYRDETYEYTFDTWRPAIVPVTENKTYTAVYSREHISYYVTWIINGVSERQQYYYGVTPSHSTPQSYRDETYEYTFDSWNPDIVPVTGDAEYTAIFSREHISYYVTWEMDDGEVIQRQQYFYGDTPSHQAPSKPATAQYTYTFAGWNPPITIVTGDKTYTATFTSTVNNYVITWNNWDGSRLKQETLAYGSTPVYTGATPTRPGDSQHTYIFTGWDPEIVTVTGNKTYTALYEEIVTHEVSFVVRQPDPNYPSITASPTQIESQTVLHGQKATQPESPVASDSQYFVVNWEYYDADDDNRWEAWDFNDSIDKNITLYTKWEYQSCKMIIFITESDSSDIKDGNNGYFGEDVEFESKSYYGPSHYGIIECTGDGCITNLDSKCGFKDATDLYEVILPSSLVEIGSKTFDDSDLAKADLRNVQVIGAHSFEGCDFYAFLVDDGTQGKAAKIDEYNNMGGCLVVSNNLRQTGYRSLSDCDNLMEAEIPSTVTQISAGLFKYDHNLEKVLLPNTLTVIGESAFQSCTSLSAITIPAGVTSIGGGAFNNCSSIPAITLPTSLTIINASTFSHCSSLSAITLPNTLTVIGNYAFQSCTSLSTITIPAGVTSIGGGAFESCSSLSAITIPNGVTRIENTTFYGCSSLTAVTIPNGVTSIGASAFGGCISLSSVTIPNRVTCIEDSVFRGCTSLTSVTIPNSVTSIGYYCFAECNSLTSVTIGNSVTSIEYESFSGCTSLASVTCKATTPPTISWNTFNNVPTGIPVYVPSGSVSAYRQAQYWSVFTNIQAIQ